MTCFKRNTMPLLIITFIFPSWLFFFSPPPYSHKPTNCGVHVYSGRRHNNSARAPTQPHNNFPFFFAVISVPPSPARMLQGWGDHRGVTLVCLWFLDKLSGPRLRLRSFFPPFHPSFHWGNKTAPLWGGETFSPISFALKLWRQTQTNNITFTMKKHVNEQPNVHVLTLLSLPPLQCIYSICCTHLFLSWSLTDMY